MSASYDGDYHQSFQSLSTPGRFEPGKNGSLGVAKSPPAIPPAISEDDTDIILDGGQLPPKNYPGLGITPGNRVHLASPSGIDGRASPRVSLSSKEDELLKYGMTSGGGSGKQ
jgi:hypothetical protein